MCIPIFGVAVIINVVGICVGLVSFFFSTLIAYAIRRVIIDKCILKEETSPKFLTYLRGIGVIVKDMLLGIFVNSWKLVVGAFNGLLEGRPKEEKEEEENEEKDKNVKKVSLTHGSGLFRVHLKDT